MKLVELNKKDFQKFADNHELITFHQTKQWARLKEFNGWHAYYVGLEHKGNIQAAALLLSKQFPIIRKRMFYSPRGLLINYKDIELVKAFTKELKEFVKSKKGIFLKIDPFLPYKEHDNNGNIVEGGFDNSRIVDSLISDGYKYFGFNLMQDTLQPRWMHVIDVKDRTLDDVMSDMESKTRQILRKNEKCGITVREIEKKELSVFKDIMQHTGERREFIDRPLSYYERMWDTLHDDGILKIYFAEIDFDVYKSNTVSELEEIKREMEDREYKKTNNILKMNESKFNVAQEKAKKDIERLTKQVTTIDDYLFKYGHRVILGGIMFLNYGKEVLSLFGGSNAKFMNFQSAYTLHFEGIKTAINEGYERYNFYGITGDFNKENPLYGLYLFKKSFGGKVVELIGEFDLVVNDLWYKIYTNSFKVYHKIKNIKKKSTK